MTQQIQKFKGLLSQKLPDGGAKIHSRIAALQHELAKLQQDAALPGASAPSATSSRTSGLTPQPAAAPAQQQQQSNTGTRSALPPQQSWQPQPSTAKIAPLQQQQLLSIATGKLAPQQQHQQPLCASAQPQQASFVGNMPAQQQHPSAKPPQQQQEQSQSAAASFALQQSSGIDFAHHQQTGKPPSSLIQAATPGQGHSHRSSAAEPLACQPHATQVVNAQDAETGWASSRGRAYIPNVAGLTQQIKQMKSEMIHYAKMLDDPQWKQQQPDKGKAV